MVDAEPDVEVDVREDLREVAGLPVVRVAVQEQQIRPVGLDQLDPRRQEQGVALVQPEVGVAVPGVQLQRQTTVDSCPEQEAQQHRVPYRDRSALLALRQPRSRCLDDLGSARSDRIEVESVPVCDDALEADGN